MQKEEFIKRQLKTLACLRIAFYAMDEGLDNKVFTKSLKYSVSHTVEEIKKSIAVLFPKEEFGKEMDAADLQLSELERVIDEFLDEKY